MADNYTTPMSEAMYYILLSLCNPLHGYALIDEVKRVSNNRVNMGAGTLYGILKRLQSDHYITLEEFDGRRKIYKITTIGRHALKQEYLRLSKMVNDGESLFGKEKADES